MVKKELYRQFCAKEKDIPIFSQPWYLDGICGESGWDILLVKKGDEVAASMPFQLYKKYSFHMARMPLLTKYWGPYFSKKFRHQQQKLMSELIKQFPSFDYFEQYFHPSITDSLPFHWGNFETNIRYSFLIDLDNNIENLFSKMDGDYRNNKIPKAEKLVHITSDRTLEELYELQKMTFDRQKTPVPFSFNFLKKYDRLLSNHNARKMFFAVDVDNQIHASAYLIWDKETAYFLLAGNDSNLKNSGAGIFLTWHVIKYAKEVLQKKQFDFLGSMIKPITKVRENFGAKRTPYFQVSKYQSRLLMLLQTLRG